MIQNALRLHYTSLYCIVLYYTELAPFTLHSEAKRSIPSLGVTAASAHARSRDDNTSEWSGTKFNENL